MLDSVFETPQISSNLDEIMFAAMKMSEELRPMLMDDESFRSIVVEYHDRRRQILMSGGGLLARLHRLQHQRSQLTSDQKLVLDTAQEQTDETVNKLSDTFYRILQREATIRIEYLQRFLDEGEEDSAYFCDEFPVEMRNRQRIEEIIKALGDQADSTWTQELDRQDNRMRTLCHPASFIWDINLKPIYPPNQYWFLYIEPEAE